jgi:hypothetical protein
MMFGIFEPSAGSSARIRGAIHRPLDLGEGVVAAWFVGGGEDLKAAAGPM